MRLSQAENGENLEVAVDATLPISAFTTAVSGAGEESAESTNDISKDPCSVRFERAIQSWLAT